MDSKRVRLITILALASVLAIGAGCSRGRSDAQLAAEVQNKINQDAAITNKQLTVTSSNGVVTLTGTVASELERVSAANDAAQVEGVKTVINNLQVPTVAASDIPQAQQQYAAEQQAASAPASAPARRTQRPRPSPVYQPAANTIPVTAPETQAAAPATQAVPASRPAAPAPEPVTVDAGTVISIRTIDEISTEEAQAGESFRATLDAPIYASDRVVVPAGADIEGRIVNVASAGKFKGQSQLGLELTRLVVNGKTYDLSTNQYTREGASRGKRTAATVGGGAAVGAVIGAIAGGGKGAAIGAAIGAGTGTGVQAVTKGEQIRIKPETVLTFQLQSPLSVLPVASVRSEQRQRLEFNDNEDKDAENEN